MYENDNGIRNIIIFFLGDMIVITMLKLFF